MQARRDVRYSDLYERWRASVEAYRQSLHIYQRFLSRRAQRPATSSPATAPVLPILTLAPAIEPGQTKLTRRQHEIATLIARGYTNRQIASELWLTPGTVANHVRQILTRLGLRSRTEVAVWLTRGAQNLDPH